MWQLNVISDPRPGPLLEREVFIKDIFKSTDKMERWMVNKNIVSIQIYTHIHIWINTQR